MTSRTLRAEREAVSDRFGPKAAAISPFEEQTGFDVHPHALATGNEGENERDELWKGKHAVAGEIFGRLFDFGIDFFWDEIKKGFEDDVKLA